MGAWCSEQPGNRAGLTPLVCPWGGRKDVLGICRQTEPLQRIFLDGILNLFPGLFSFNTVLLI